MRRKLLWLVLVIIFSPAISRATKIYVDSSNIAGNQFGTSWADAYYSFDFGVLFSNPGDTILVAKGTYQPNSGAYFKMKENVKIFGGFLNTDISFSQRNPATRVTILKGNNHSVIRNDSILGITPLAVLDGFTITRGIAASNEAGGGMYNNHASPTITNCIFTRNTTSQTTTGGGGGMYNYHSSPLISYCTFSFDTVRLFIGSPPNATGSGNGGAIANISSSPVITHCNFTGNVAIQANGGAIFNSKNSSPLISYCTFDQNKCILGVSASYLRGGAICHLPGGIANLDSCTFTGNSSAQAPGGALYADSVQLKLYRCQFKTNLSNTTTGDGGGAVATSRLLPGSYIDSCYFFSNTSNQNGGAIHNNNTKVTITNSTFFRNRSTESGGAVYNLFSFPFVNKCTFLQNRASGNAANTSFGYLTLGGAICSKGSNDSSFPHVIKNCSFTKDSAGNGAGVYFMTSANYLIDSCSFDLNVAMNDDGGGAVGTGAQNTHSKLIHCTFNSNKAINGQGGGAIYINNYADMIIDSCSFNANTTSNVTPPATNLLAGGGAILMSTGVDTVEITHSTFTSNRARSGGAILYMWPSSNPAGAFVNNCSFNNNVADSLGGAIGGTMRQVYNCSLIADTAGRFGGAIYGGKYPIINCRIEGNKARRGGGIYSVDTTTLINSLVVKNYADTFGGGMYNAAPPRVTSTTFANNRGLISGGAIYNTNFGNYNDSSFTNCIVWGNNTGVFNQNTSNSVFSYSLVQGLGAFPAKHLLSGSANPMFVDTLIGDYHLLGTSPCIDTGKNSAMPLGIATDYDGNPRIANGKIDLGAYEFPCTSPFISITTNNTSVCSGSQVTIPVGSGTTPGSYQWKVNGLNVGTNSSTYTYIPVNGDQVTCALSTSGTCYPATVVTSNTITISVVPLTVPTVSISGPTIVCGSSPVAFTATTNVTGGSYQWKVNNVNVGTNSSSYSYSPANNDQVSVVITAPAGTCYSTSSATSNTLPVVVSSSIAPSISIAGLNSACSGSAITYTATTNVSGGTIQWKVNNVNAGINSTTYIYTPINGDVITAEVTAPSGGCYTSTLAISNGITMSLIPTITPAVTVSGNSTICAGTSTIYTATTNVTGAIYQWLLNNVNAGTNANTYTYMPVNGDQVNVVITTPTGCYTATSATGTPVTVTVMPNTTPTLSISAGSNNVCAGTSVTYTATANVTGGTYQWKVNSINAGTNSNGYTYSPANGDQVSCEIITPPGCFSASTATSNIINMVVNPIVTPTATILGSTAVCVGISSNYIATTNITGGSYQWKVNGLNVGTNSSSYSYNPVNNDQVSVVITVPSNSCYSASSATSNTIAVTVSSSVAPSISIAGPNSVCSGIPVTYTATTNVSGGTIQWKVNNVNAGTNSTTYIYTPANGDVIAAEVTAPSGGCYSSTFAISNSIAISLIPSINPTATIAGNSTVCAGTSTTYTATTNVTGATYQWQVNNVNAGTNASIYSYTPLNGDQVNVIITTPSGCFTATTVTSNVIAVVVNANTTPTITSSASNNNICTGTSVTFTATTNISGGTYQWKVNGINVGTNTNMYSFTPVNNDVVTVTLSAPATGCYSPSSVTSTGITMNVIPNITPSASIAGPATVCAGNSATYTATTNVTSASYQWKVNSVNAGTNANTYNYTPANNDLVSVEITTPAGCFTTATATSNSITVSATAPVAPTASVSASANNICDGGVISFTATTNVTGGNYQWKVNGVNAGTNNNSYSYAPANNDLVTIEVTTPANGCYTTTSTTSAPVTMTVQPMITPAIALSGVIGAGVGASVTITATITNGPATYSIDWLNNNVLFSTTSAPAVTYTKTAGTDVITATLSTTTGCYNTATSAGHTVIEALGITETTKNERIAVYPNPVENRLTVEGLHPKDELLLTDVAGRVIFQWKASKEKHVLSLDVVLSGYYVLRILNEKGETRVNIPLRKQ